MDQKKQAHHLARQIRNSMAHARPEHKQRFAELLERTLAEAEVEQPTREQLEANLVATEILAKEFSLISKQNHYVLNQVESEIQSLISRMPELLDRYSIDIKDSVNNAVQAIRWADAAIFETEKEIRNQLRRIGWDIHENESDSIAESGVDGINQEAYDLGYKSFQTRRTTCPYKMGTEKQRSWIEGFTAAGRENLK